MNLSDTFYVALCMTVLILGVVYWFWTQNQFIQRKLNLLENIVYEMRSASNAHVPEGLVDKALAAAAAGAGAATSSDAVASYAPAPEEEGEDDIVHATLSDELVAAELTLDSDELKPMPETTLSTFDTDDVVEAVAEDDLAPGATLGAAAATTAASEDLGTTKGTVLDNMTLKELKQLAEQKGVKGAKSMRKHELVEAIRNSKVSVSPFDIHEGVVSLE
jgi:hypothetical protein